MSITLGNYLVQTKKTVGELPTNVDDILVNAECEDTINTNLVQPQWKKIHEYTGSVSSTPKIGGGGHEIEPIFKGLPDDLFANGFDYRVTISYTYSAPIATEKNFFSYTIGGNNWYHDIDGGGATIKMNENNCGGNYANTARALILESEGLNPYTFDYTVEIEQLIPATIEIDLCGGGTVTHLTTLEEKSELIQVFQEGEPLGYDVNSTYRDSNYDPFDIGNSEIAKMPQTCTGFRVYYIANIFSSPYVSPNEKTYWVENAVNEIKIDIPIVPPKVLDFKFDGSIASVFPYTSDANGLVDWTTFIGATTNENYTMELWDGLIQETSSGEQYVYLKYSLISSGCPCTNCADCGDVNIIFYQSCGDQHGLKFNYVIQEGKYNIEGETFTQGNEIIRPISKIKASYDMVISDYSDETYLLLMELISDNIKIGIIDNIDVSNPETFYYIDTELLTPNWNFNSKLGNLTIPLIKENSIKTKRRNCCN